MPQTLGHSVSLVAALIIGDAAIGAGLLSTPVILVASITAISVFVTPSLYEPATLLRLGVTLAAGRGRAGRSGVCGLGRVGRTDVHLRDGGTLSFGRSLFG